ncbi:glycosyltransferase [Microbispora sp. CA-135349]|uniref:glycosyltransferase n=1 Tax=Microbispora sp. CA-135349 TaxID=3239953 RepID=UPI003D915E68
MTFAAFYLLSVGLYASVGAVHVLLRRRLKRQHQTRGSSPQEWPAVDVVVPVFNEAPDELDGCLASVAAARYSGPLTVYVVDDGSADSPERTAIYKRYAALPFWNILRHSSNQGKRHAQHTAFANGRGSLVLCVDSDTRIAPDSVEALARHLQDTRVGAVTGAIHIRPDGPIQRLCGVELDAIAAVDRLAQSTYGAVLCCAGAFVMYRRSALQSVWAAYLRQRFLGLPVRQGEDLHLTNLLLEAGLRTRFAPDGHAWTVAPDRLSGYARQQLRWSRTHWRELRWLVPQLGHLPPFLSLDTAVWSAPALLYAALPLLWATTSAPIMGAAAAVLAIAELLLTIARTNGHFLWPQYACLRVLVQIPVQLWALITVPSQAWLTREEVPGIR